MNRLRGKAFKQNLFRFTLCENPAVDVAAEQHTTSGQVFETGHMQLSGGRPIENVQVETMGAVGQPFGCGPPPGKVGEGAGLRPVCRFAVHLHPQPNLPETFQAYWIDGAVRQWPDVEQIVPPLADRFHQSSNELFGRFIVRRMLAPAPCTIQRIAGLPVDALSTRCRNNLFRGCKIAKPVFFIGLIFSKVFPPQPVVNQDIRLVAANKFHEFFRAPRFALILVP